jgi:hypothetical protein
MVKNVLSSQDIFFTQIYRNMKNIFLILFLILSASGAFSQKKKPDWVLNYPILENDYIGIASASKSNPNYKELAKQNALNMLSNSISVNVSVVSVFAQNETNKQFTEEFNEVTKTQTKNFIEGFEIQAEWEDKKNYWVFIKINKQKFLENKERRKNEATLQAFDIYKNALSQDNANQIQLALLNYTRALSLLSPFLSETIVVTDNGKSLYLANEIINQVSKLFKEINFSTSKPTLKTYQAQALSNIEISAHRGSTNLSNIPVKFETSDVEIIGSNHQTDKAGKCIFSTNAFLQKDKQNFLISVSVNFEALLKEATQDNLVINLFANLTPNVLTIKIENSNSLFDRNDGALNQGTGTTSTFPNQTGSENNNQSAESLKYTNFETMRDALKYKFMSEQIEIIKFNAPNLPIDAKQLASLISILPFDKDKIDVVKIYLPYLTSKPKNLYEILAREITFDNYKIELKRILEAGN